MSSSESLAQSMSISEMLRIMDVASELRKQQDLVEKEFRSDEQRAELRAKLIEASHVTGEDVSKAELDAAIDWYFNHLHTFREPKFSFGLILAHVYIRRHWVWLGLGIVACYVGWSWWLG